MNSLPLLYSNTILWIRIIVALVLLLLASISDFRTRMVDDWIWAPMIIIGSITAVFEALLFQDLRILLDLAINVGLAFAIAFLLFYAGLFGGADGKALIGISFLFPIPPLPFLGWGFRPLLPFFFLTILSNALILTVLVPLCLFIRNLIDYITENALFLGLENEAFWKKVVCLFVGLRIPLSVDLPHPHVYPLISIVEVNGVLTPRLNLFKKVSDEFEESDDTNLQTIKEFLYHGTENTICKKKIWVSPGIPFIIPITLGFITALMSGDILLLILNFLLP